MRLFCYYAFHSLINQIRKLLKTWVLIFLLVCMVMGGLIGFFVATLSDAADEQQESAIEETVPEDEDTLIEIEVEAPTRDQVLPIAELVVGGVLLALFVWEALNADRSGGKIFLPADVNLLFPSPMKPQSVLFFRLMTQIGMAIFASIYMLIQLPNLTENLGLSLPSALAVVATWGLTIIVTKLVQVLLYTLASTHPALKENLRRGVFAVIGVIALGFFLFWKAGGASVLDAAKGYFNAPLTRFLPFWGWLKGFAMFAIEENWTMAFLCLGLLLVGGGILAYVIWHVKADFYEDALAKSEETAALLEAAQSEKSGMLINRRGKDRSEKLRRDGMSRGEGANVFFFKALYNRFRFAHLGVFTKTSETYVAAGLGVALLCRLVFQAPGLTWAALALGVLVFFRSLGNPLEEDTKMDSFVLIPESTWAKMFYSLLGGCTNCALDVAMGLVAAELVLWENPLIALAWLLFIVSVDYYATNVGTFIDLSVPTHAGKTVKQIVQVMFVYFGLLPDIGLIAVGFVFGFLPWAVVGAVFVNLVLGSIFFALSPLFLDPQSR